MIVADTDAAADVVFWPPHRADPREVRDGCASRSDRPAGPTAMDRCDVTGPIGR